MTEVREDAGGNSAPTPATLPRGGVRHLTRAGWFRAAWTTPVAFLAATGVVLAVRTLAGWQPISASSPYS
jgi:hypothetical protein